VRVHISANVEVFTGGHHRSCQKGRQKEEQLLSRGGRLMY